MARARTRAPKGFPQAETGQASDPEAAGQLRRSEILAIAAKHFAEHGFEATTIRQISDEAGILSGSLYYYFTNKEEMMHDIMRPFVNDLISRYQYLSRLPDTADLIIAKMIRFALDQITTHLPEHRIIFNDRNYFRRTPQFNYVAALGAEVSHAWYGAIQQGVREGIFRSDINTRLTTTIVLKMISATADWYDPSGHDSMEDMIKTQESLILYGLRDRGPAAERDGAGAPKRRPPRR
jgi:AcrR family transcriptional regulator